MKTFSQYLEEKKIMTAALAGIVGGIPLGMAGRPTPKQEVPQQVQASPKTVAQEQPKTEQRPSEKSSTKVDGFHEKLKQKHDKEYDTIMDAATNNGISKDDHENLSVLFAIRKAENGGPGVEFGVLHPKAKGTNLRTQAGWAAATIVKNRGRHNSKEHGDFINFLGSRYAPKGAENDPKGLNANWIKNVKTHYQDNIGNTSND